jgi:sugar/nucleoside kinase (ribokinase family)
MDVLTIGEVLVEFVRLGKDQPHRLRGQYAGPFPSGAPAIFADTAARLGMKSAIIGAVGEDDFGTLLRDRLLNDGVNVERLLRDGQNTTGIAFVTYYSNGGRDFLFHLKRSAAAKIKPSDVERDFVKSFRALLIMGSTLSMNGSIREACYKAVRIASRSGMIIAYDPNVRAELIEPRLMREISAPLLNAAEILIPSKKELLDLTGENTVDEASEQVLKHGVENLVVKLGREGSMVITKQARVLRSSYDVDEVDPTGAGDAFDAGLLRGYLRNESPEALLDFANAVGALKVTKIGPMEVPGSLTEVTAFMKESKKSHR